MAGRANSVLASIYVLFCCSVNLNIAVWLSFAVLQDDIMPKYAELVYNGFWFSPEREALQALVDKTQESVTGTVRLKLYKVGGDQAHSVQAP